MQCNQCGADLPEEARFCLHCGAPVPKDQTEVAEGPGFSPSPAQSPVDQTPLDFVQPALAGGMFLGVLSSLPFINIGNCLCCMWVLAGGGIAAVLLSRQRPSGITYGDGAFVGVMSGLCGSVIGTAVHIPVQIISSRIFGSQPQEIEELFQRMGIEGPMRDWMMRIVSGEISVGTVLFTFFSYLVMWSLFAMIGGIITVAIMNKRAQGGQNRPPVQTN